MVTPLSRQIAATNQTAAQTTPGGVALDDKGYRAGGEPSIHAQALFKGPPEQPLNLHYNAINQIMPTTHGFQGDETLAQRREQMPYMQKAINTVQQNYHYHRDAGRPHEEAWAAAAKSAAHHYNALSDLSRKATVDEVLADPAHIAHKNVRHQMATFMHPHLGKLLQHKYETQVPDDTFTDW